MMPLVTICLPVFNKQEYLHETIQSMKSQTYQNIQIVAVDNCSTDDSYRILKSYESASFIVKKNSSNLGMKKNWNKCLEFADGRYIKLMPADDVLMPDCIAKQVDILESVDVDLVSSNRYIISDAGQVLLKLKYPLHGYIPPEIALRRLVGAGRNIIGEPASCLMRKEALLKIGGFSALNHYVIDIETWAKLLRGKGLFAMDDYLCSFRISNTSTSAEEGLNQIRSVFEFISSFDASDVGFYTKIKAYFWAVTYGILRNIVFRFANRTT
jgi:glycosyltransferase involved in cell wall biosynthesis